MPLSAPLYASPIARPLTLLDRAYGDVDGLTYRYAHNDEPALMLYERAIDALRCPADAVARLDDAVLFSISIFIMQRNNPSFRLASVYVEPASLP